MDSEDHCAGVQVEMRDALLGDSAKRIPRGQLKVGRGVKRDGQGRLFLLETHLFLIYFTNEGIVLIKS